MGTDPGTNSSTQHGGGGEGTLIKLWYNNINIIQNDSTSCILCLRPSFFFIFVQHPYHCTKGILYDYLLGITLFHRIEATDTRYDQGIISRTK
mmetsp:Transcript_27712/g.31025  ORF Transcript_27712/g.31025 Transcript_27712/m.31025 type:complete len:93 (+) Transcript_27712:1552-1830(+)